LLHLLHLVLVALVSAFVVLLASIATVFAFVADPCICCTPNPVIILHTPRDFTCAFVATDFAFSASSHIFAAFLLHIYCIMGSSDVEKLSDILHFPDWAMQMEALLEKELWDTVTGDESHPTSGSNSKAMKAYVCKQKLAKAKIILHLDKS
jgi:hypothetical protein